MNYKTQKKILIAGHPAGRVPQCFAGEGLKSCVILYISAFFCVKSARVCGQCQLTKVNEGFSLVELLVTIGIFVIVTGVILFNFRSFDSRIVLDNLAYEVALTVRQAQVFGTSVKEAGAGSELFPSYGVFFSTFDDNAFTLFADVFPVLESGGDGKYGAGDILIDQFSIQKGNYISQLCGYVLATSSCTPLDALHVSYVRPNPEGVVIGVTGSGDAQYSFAEVTLSTPSGENTKTVTIWANGQIAVQ